MRNQKKRYYIGKKQYIPEESDLLCVSDKNDFVNIATRKLYRTGNGAFFLVSETQENGTKVQLMDEEQAFHFMDENPAGIDVEIYDRIFGEPDRA